MYMRILIIRVSTHMVARTEDHHLPLLHRPGDPIARPAFVMAQGELPPIACTVRVVCNYHAAIACGEVLALLEAEAANMADRATEAALVIREQRLSAILDHTEIMLGCNIHDRIHIGW